MAPALVSSQGTVSCSVSSRQIDEHTGWRAPPTLPGLLLYFGTLKMFSVAKGLLQLCAQSHGCFSSVSSGDVPGAAKQRLLPGMRNCQLETWTRLMHDRDVFYRGVRVMNCFQCHPIVLRVPAAFTWGGVTPSWKHLFHRVNHPHMDTSVSSTCEWWYELHYGNFWKDFAVSFWNFCDFIF